MSEAYLHAAMRRGRWSRLVWRRLGWWPRLASRVAIGRPYALSDSPMRRVRGQSLVHWLRFGRVGASHYLLAGNPDWRRVLLNHGRNA